MEIVENFVRKYCKEFDERVPANDSNELLNQGQIDIMVDEYFRDALDNYTLKIKNEMSNSGYHIIDKVVYGKGDFPPFYLYSAYIEVLASMIENNIISGSSSCNTMEIEIILQRRLKEIIFVGYNAAMEEQAFLRLFGKFPVNKQTNSIINTFYGISKCRKLIFENSYTYDYFGQKITWHCDELRKTMEETKNDDNVSYEALMSLCTEYGQIDHDDKENNLVITLEGVNDDLLLDIESVKNYIKTLENRNIDISVFGV